MSCRMPIASLRAQKSSVTISGRAAFSAAGPIFFMPSAAARRSVRNKATRPLITVSSLNFRVRISIALPLMKNKLLLLDSIRAFSQLAVPQMPSASRKSPLPHSSDSFRQDDAAEISSGLSPGSVWASRFAASLAAARFVSAARRSRSARGPHFGRQRLGFLGLRPGLGLLLLILPHLGDSLLGVFVSLSSLVDALSNVCRLLHEFRSPLGNFRVAAELVGKVRGTVVVVLSCTTTSE